MRCRAAMAMMVAAGLLAACGGGQTGSGAAAPPGSSASTGQNRAASQAPAAGQAKATGPSSSAAPPAAQHATLANNGKVLTLAVGGRLTLTLPAPADWHWAVQKPGGGVLRPESPTPAGATAAFRAVAAGTTFVHAAEVPPCVPHCPGHATGGPSFVMGVRVLPPASPSVHP